MIDVSIGECQFQVAENDTHRILIFEPLLGPGVPMGIRIHWHLPRLEAVQIGRALQGTHRSAEDGEPPDMEGAILLDNHRKTDD